MDRSIEQTYNIKASPEAVWRALTDPKEIQEWSGANAYFIPQAGALYTLWDGTIGGKIVEVVPMRKLVQTWKPQEWTREDSVVTFTLTPTRDGTRVDLLHVNVEESDFDGSTKGWDIYYLGVIKRCWKSERETGKSSKTGEENGGEEEQAEREKERGQEGAKKITTNGNKFLSRRQFTLAP
jgi:uncharacterized protein YndB with AHSA1/START domain